MILKTHRFNQDVVNNASFVVYSYRDIRDAFASSVRKFNTQPTLAEAKKVLEDHEKWIDSADFIMRYENMIEDKIGTIGRIVDSLSNEIESFSELKESSKTSENISVQIDKLTTEKVGSQSEHHRESLLYEDHVTHGGVNTWHEILDGDFVDDLTRTYSWWFKKYGYSN